MNKQRTIDTRSVDDLGRVVIPKVLRDQYDITEGDEISFSERDGFITMQKARQCCCICRSLENLTEIADEHRSICQVCYEKIKGM